MKAQKTKDGKLIFKRKVMKINHWADPKKEETPGQKWSSTMRNNKNKEDPMKSDDEWEQINDRKLKRK